MLWIKSYYLTAEHPKTILLSELMEWTIYSVVGALDLFWQWASKFAADGDITNFRPRQITESCRIDGDPQRFIDALIEAGFVDRVGDKLLIHDWNEYMSPYENAKAQARERSRRARAAASAAKVAKAQEDASIQTDEAANAGGVASSIGDDRHASDANVSARHACVTRDGCVMRPLHHDKTSPVTPQDIDLDGDKRSKDHPTGHARRVPDKNDVLDPELLTDIDAMPVKCQAIVRYLLSETGREGISQSELEDLKVTLQDHYEARILHEIDTITKRFDKKGITRAQITFGYIRKALQHQRSIRKNMPKARSPADSRSERQMDDYSCMVANSDDYLNDHGEEAGGFAG